MPMPVAEPSPHCAFGKSTHVQVSLGAAIGPSKPFHEMRSMAAAAGSATAIPATTPNA